MPANVFKDLDATQARLWGKAPQRLHHGWASSALFSLDALAGLIERYPAEHCSLVATSSQGSATRRWREGELGGLNGRQVIDTIARGGLWLNLRNVHLVDPRYGALQDAAYAELRAALPGFDAGALRMGILISSPLAQVHYHADMPGQTLWQIAGRKRVYIYPPHAPYLPAAALEDIALSGVEVTLPYDPAFDHDAVLMELAPGQMLHWPLNSPHRVDNLDCLNISVTTEHWTPRIRRSQMVTLANGVLRRHLGHTPRSRALSGPGFWAKAVLQAVWRRSPWAQRLQRQARPIDFRLSTQAPGGMTDIAPYHR